MSTFATDTVLVASDICNLQATRLELLEGVKAGNRFVFFGLRNTGKTSLLKSIVIPAFQQDNPKATAIFLDVMDVKSEDDFSRRLQAALEEGISKSTGAKDFVKNLVKSLKQIRPQFQIDPSTSETSFSLGYEPNERTLPIQTLFKEIGASHKTQKALIVIDEFQDIEKVPALAAKLRRYLQELPSDLPVIVSGSKKHILSRMFADPRAPFAGWGRPIEIETISVDDYLPYANQRFQSFKLTLTREACEFLHERMRQIPEPMNIVCDQLTRSNIFSREIFVDHVMRAIKTVIKQRSSLYIERLGRYTEKDQRFLKAVADLQIVEKPTGKHFLKRANLSASGCLSMLRKLEDAAMIYKNEVGYYVADPLLEIFLRDHMR
jgi:hypothetical protein